MSKAFTSVLLLLALAACGKSEDWNEPEAPASTTQVGQPPANKVVQRTILNMVVAGSIDAKGVLVGEAYTFTPEQPQITVIARVGKIAEGSSIRFAWYQETDDEDEPLFDQTVTVVSFDRAYSEGKNPGTLAPGIYKVTATVGDDMREIEFTVAPQLAKSTKRSALEMGAVWLSAFSVTPANAQSPASEPDLGEPPVAGASGAIHGPLPASGTAPLSPVARQCGVDLLTYDGDGAMGLMRSASNLGSQEHLGFAETILVRNQCGTGNDQPVGVPEGALAGGVISASHNGVSVELHRFPDYPPDMNGYEFDPCASESGWDLPREKVTVTFHPGNWPASAPALSAVFVLYGDGSPPKLEVHSTPAKNTKVKAGDKIEIKITARDDNPSVWESGLQKMWLTGPAGDVGKAEVNPSPVAQACAKKAKKHTYTTTYTVPSNPPDVIKLCAHAQDYAGNKREKCTTFPTHDLFTYHEWEGDIKKEFVQQANQDPVPKLNGKWVETFHVKFVQVPGDTKSSKTHNDGTSSDSYIDDFYPLALDYTLVATYSETLPGNHTIDVSGSATGHLRGDTLVKKPTGREKNVPETSLDNDPKHEGKWVRLPALKGMFLGGGGDRLSGEILRIADDHPGNAGQEERHNSDAEECAFYGDLPGDFRLIIDLGARGGSTVDWTDQEKQALLNGIEISGTAYGEKAEGQRDVSQFQHLIRADLCGRILRADQKQVTGSRSFEVKESGGIPGQQGRITWSFRRTAKQIAYEKK